MAAFATAFDEPSADLLAALVPPAPARTDWLASPAYVCGLSGVRAVARLHGAELILDDNAPGLRVILRFAPDSIEGAHR